MFVSSLVGGKMQMNQRYPITLAPHPHRDVTGKIESTSIVTEISDISPALVNSQEMTFWVSADQSWF